MTQQFTPADLPDLARLTQLLATEISGDGSLDEGLRDNLSCLAARLDAVLPTSQPMVPPLPSNLLVNALRQIVHCFLDDDGCCVAQTLPKHIHDNMLLVDRWLDGELDDDGESTT